MDTSDGRDPFRLSRFVEAQERDYDTALAEIRAGEKVSHWMWYIFPQIAGLGASPTSRFYAITGVDEARAYLDHPVLGPRLRACAEALLALQGRTAVDVFGGVDAMKLQSSATLFAAVDLPGSVFHRLLDLYFGGDRDPRTVARLTPSSC